MSFRYEALHTQALDCLKEALRSHEIQPLASVCRPLIEQDRTLEADVKTVVDNSFKDLLHELIKLKEPDCDLMLYESLLNLSIESTRRDISTGNLPVMLLSDLFDCKTLSQCESLFELVEKRVDVWKEAVFFKHVKNQLLRSCNDLLRRLSRSQNTVFCGRILVFLARFFPLFERSGLNLISEFNHDNVINISLQDDGILSESMMSSDTNLEEGEMPATETIQVDYNLYRKFWLLQEFFRTPVSCYNKPKMKQFQSFSNDVLSAFTSYKLDSSSAAHLQGIGVDTDSVYFSKYLTNQKLLELQLSDSNFRRYILVQFLLLFQYLAANVRFKQELHVLNEDQTDWVKETTDKIYQLIEETPPNGSEMKKCVEHLLKREEHWNAWKNEGCSGLKEAEETVTKTVTRKRRIGDELRNSANTGKVYMGNPELTRLWNLYPDNSEACKSKKRIFTPTVEKYFETVIHAKEEERQQKINKDNEFSWRALRLLSQKSPHFFTPSNQMVKPLSHYLESAVEKLSKDLAVGGKNKSVPDLAIDDAEDISDDELLKQVDDTVVTDPSETPPVINNGNDSQSTPNGVSGAITAGIISEVALKLKEDWKKLAPTLKFQADEILYFESEYKDVVAQAQQMLTVWMEQETPENATIANLQEAVTKSNLNIKI